MRQPLRFHFLLVIVFFASCAVTRAQSEERMRENGQLLRTLEEKIDLKDFQNALTFQEALQMLHEKLAAGAAGVELPILVDKAALRGNDNQVDNLDAAIIFPPFPRYMSVGQALAHAVSQAPDAAYIIRRSRIEVTSKARASIRGLLRQNIAGHYVKISVKDAVQEISDNDRHYRACRSAC